MAKNISLILLILVALSIHSNAQSLEIIPQANYTIGGKIYARYGELIIQDSESYGLSVNFVQSSDVSFQLEYFYQPTVGEYRDFFNPAESNQTADLRISWLMAGARKRFPVNDRIVPFGGASLGLTNFDLDSMPTSYDE